MTSFSEYKTFSLKFYFRNRFSFFKGMIKIFAMYDKIHNIIIPTQIHPLHTKIKCDGDYCMNKIPQQFKRNYCKSI